MLDGMDYPAPYFIVSIPFPATQEVFAMNR